MPHSAVELPFNYFDESIYQKEFIYEKIINQKASWTDKEVCLVFEATMANAHIYLNDKKIVSHTDGYTPFIARLTDELKKGENKLRVQIDGRENPSIPPFGGRIDYLTYAGIYRDVHLRITSPIFIHNIKIETPDVLEEKKSLKVRVDLLNPKGLNLSGLLTANLLNSEGKILSNTKYEITEKIFFLR